MMIRIICLGKIKEEYLKLAIEDYSKRISKYHKIEIIELKDDDNISIEEKELLKYVDNKDYNIALDIGGIKVSSTDLAMLIDKTFCSYGRINFIVGSSNGLSEIVKNKCQLKMSFGDITMPHGIFRLVLLEQIYRCFKINNNESYHK
ncbi:MAG: 23S rRNA (pseudouridine(1915)-N(3))-methyltransferase RlmH [Bacilli bacterium]|nr:23S rRNA (pseudouridine(1915)-N(3))-methyltransferase RlmH [Bacilli bacterium]